MTNESISTKIPPPVDNAAWKEIVLQIPEALDVAGFLADHRHGRPLRGGLVFDVSLPGRFPGGWCVPLAVLAGGLLVRVFIIFHDCGHGSFFKSRGANDAVGFIAGILTFTPYYHWRWEHAIHHSSAGDLDKRGTGDVWTMTVQEYLESSRWKKFAYRLARNPFVLFVLAPIVSVSASGSGFRRPKPASGNGIPCICMNRGDSRHGDRLELTFSASRLIC